MKRICALTTVLFLSLSLTSNATASRASYHPASSRALDYYTPLLQGFVDFVVDQLFGGTRACDKPELPDTPATETEVDPPGDENCTTENGLDTEPLEFRFKSNDFKSGDSHVFEIENRSDKPIRLTLDTKNQSNGGDPLGTVEIKLLPFEKRSIGFIYEFEESDKASFVITEAEVFIPDGAQSSDEDDILLYVKRVNKYTPDDMADRSSAFECTIDECDRDDNTTGGDGGIAYD